MDKNYFEVKEKLRDKLFYYITACLSENGSLNENNGSDCYCLIVDETLETKINGECLESIIGNDYLHLIDCGSGYHSIAVDKEFSDLMTEEELSTLNSYCQLLFEGTPIDDNKFREEKDNLIHEIMNDYDIDYDNTAVYDYLNCDCEYDSENIYYDADKLLNDIVYRK